MQMGEKQMRGLTKALLLAATMAVPASALAQEAAAAESESADIIVTARKQEENLQNAPTTVAVVTAESIDRLGLDSLSDLSKTTSGLTFDDSFGRDANRPVIRGQANILGQSGVAFFIDGIYYSGSLADYDVDGIERIEVVKGPQSALYGRNTYSGAINIISKSAGDKFEGKISADIGENERYDITASLRGPITDSLSATVNGRFYDFGGEFRNQFDGSKIGKQSSYSFSGAFKFDNGGALTAALRSYYNRTDDGQPAIFAQSANDNNCLFDNGALFRGNGRYFCGVIRPRPISTDFKRQFVNPGNVGLESDQLNTSFRVDYDVSDKLTISSLTGYNFREATSALDADYTADSFQTTLFASFPIGAPLPLPAPRNRRLSFVGSVTDFTFENFQRTEDVSQELRLQYDSDRLHLILGGYYFDQSDDTRDTRQLPADALTRATANSVIALNAACARSPICAQPVPIAISVPRSRDVNNIDITNKAVFGSIGFDITKTLSLSVEGRYAEEKITQSTLDFDAGAPIPAAVRAKAKFTKFTPRATLSWQFRPNNLIYGVYAEGQKPGGFNGVSAIRGGLPSFGPEDVETFELGFKNRLLNGALTANLALFRNKITGYQLTQNVSVPPNQVSAVVNAGDATIKGLELELRARPDRHLTFTANFSLADSKFTRGFDENQGVLNDVADDRLVNCSIGDQFPNIAGCQSLFGSIKGKEIPRAPASQIFFDVDYNRPIGSSNWEVFAGGNVSLISSSFAQVDNLAKTGGSVVTDVRLGVQNDRYKVQFYVKNLFDEDAVAQIIRYADANNDLRRNFIAGLRPGRRIGVILTAGF
jgi:iron complex outermembrane recepter protein